MKRILFLCIVLFPTLLIAQPSDAEIKQKVIAAGATEIRFTSDKGTIHTTLTEKWYVRTMESKWNTDYPEIKRWERNEYRYDFTGGKWVFKRSYQNSSWFDGIPNPNEAEVITILEKSKVGYQNCVLEKPQFRLAPDPKWNWHTYNSVEMMVEAVYFEKTGSTEISKKKTTFPLRLYRDTGNGKHDPNTKKYFKDGAWLSVHKPIISATYGESIILEVKTYTADELNKIKTINEVSQESEAKVYVESLPKMEIPPFKNNKEAILWIHNLLYEANSGKVEFVMYKLLSSFYFEEGSSFLLNENGKTLVVNIKKGLKLYPVLYCINPEIKHEQDNMLQYYDRENQSFGRIALIYENGSYKIQDIDFYFEPSEDKIASCKQMGDTNCGAKINTESKSENSSFAIGDKVTVNWNGQNKDFYKGKIAKIDPYNSNRYFIEFESIQSAWIDAKFISITK